MLALRTAQGSELAWELPANVGMDAQEQIALKKSEIISIELWELLVYIEKWEFGLQ